MELPDDLSDLDIEARVAFLRELHEVYGWTWALIARRIGITPRSVRNWCRYGRKPCGPSVRVLEEFFSHFLEVVPYHGGRLLRYRGMSLTPKRRTVSR